MIPTLDPSITRPTQQQVFDAAVRHAGRMTEHSLSSASGVCRYRTDDGSNACLIGGMLTDEEAQRMDVPDGIMGGTGITNLLDYGTDLVPERLRDWDLRKLLPRLQGIHDAQLGLDTWPGMLRRVAEDYGLNTVVLDQTFSVTGA